MPDVRCPGCGLPITDDYSGRLECFGCGETVKVQTINVSHDLRLDNAHHKSYPLRYSGVIYRILPLWMAQLNVDRIEFEFAVEPSTLRMEKRGYKFQLVSIYAADGFPWPTDFAQGSRKDTRATSIPNHTAQLRTALAQAIARSLKVKESEIQGLKDVITDATTPMTIVKRRKTVVAKRDDLR